MRMTAVAFLGAVLMAQLAGCASTAGSSKQSEYRERPDYSGGDWQQAPAGLSKVALVNVLAAPAVEKVDLGITRGEGAAAGAAGGALLFGAQPLALCVDPLACALAIVLLPAFVIGGAIVGAAGGAVSGNPADELAKAEANARAMLDSAYLQGKILERIHEYGSENLNLQFIRVPTADPRILADKPDYSVLKRDGIDAVLEIQLVRITFEEALGMEARARLTSPNAGVVISDARYEVVSDRRSVEEWTADGAVALSTVVASALDTLAEDIVDENFLLFYPRDPVGECVADHSKPQSLLSGAIPPVAEFSESEVVPHYSLKPLYPRLGRCVLCGENPFTDQSHRAMNNLEFVKVDSTHITLRWESFPRPWDLVGAGGNAHVITDTSYDIRVFEAGEAANSQRVLVPAQQVYSVRGLHENYHKLGSELAPCKDYFWTVRARFKLDGRARVTEWAGAFGKNHQPWNLRRGASPYPDWLMTKIDGPEWFYYPFKTPCD
jgi:hypothetical protein